MEADRDRLYREAGEQFAPAVARLARAMERDAEKARDLEQDIHLELWRSFARFDGACSLKTWVFRVAHNVAADHVGRGMRQGKPLAIDEIGDLPDPENRERALAEEHAVARLHAIIRTLPLLDAQVILLWLEGHSGAEIGEVTGLSAAAAATRAHRIRGRLADAFRIDIPEMES